MGSLLWFFLALGSTQVRYSHGKPNGSALDSAQTMKHSLGNLSDSVLAGTHHNIHKNNETDCDLTNTSTAESTTAHHSLATGVSEKNSGNSSNFSDKKSSNPGNIPTITKEFNDSSQSTIEVTSPFAGNDCNVGPKNVPMNGTESTIAEGPTTDDKKVSSNFGDAKPSRSEHLPTSTVESTATPEGTNEVSVPNTGSEGDAGATNISTTGTKLITVSQTTPDNAVSSNFSEAQSSSPEHLSTSTVESTVTPERNNEVRVPNTGSGGDSNAKNISTNGTESTTVPETTSEASTTSRKWPHKQLAKRNTTKPPTTTPSDTPGTTVDLYDDDFDGAIYDTSKVTFPRRKNTTLTPELPALPRISKTIEE